MPPYEARFADKTEVQIVDRAHLEEFRSTWRYHHPLTPEQLEWAGRRAKVLDHGFYHGGDPLYWLEGVPGTWHEACLTGIDGRATE